MGGARVHGLRPDRCEAASHGGDRASHIAYVAALAAYAATAAYAAAHAGGAHDADDYKAYEAGRARYRREHPADGEVSA